jgi:hypothetical protein
MDPVLGLADRLVILDRGRIVKDGDPARVAADAAAFGIRPPLGFLQMAPGQRPV